MSMRMIVAPFGKAGVTGETTLEAPCGGVWEEGDEAWTNRLLVPSSLASGFEVLSLRVLRGGEVVGDAIDGAPVPATEFAETAFAEDVAKRLHSVDVRRGDVASLTVRRTGEPPADFFASLIVGEKFEAEPVVALP